jgi:hypothetical protein
MKRTDSKPYTRERAWEKRKDYIDLHTCSYNYNLCTRTGYVTLEESAWVVDSTLNTWNKIIIPKSNETEFDKIIIAIETYAEENGFKEVDIS